MDRKVRRKRKDSGQRSSELNKGNIMPTAKEQKTTKLKLGNKIIKKLMGSNQHIVFFAKLVRS